MIRWPRRRTVGLVALAVVAWLAVAAWLLTDARHEAAQGRDALQSVRHGASASRLLDPGTDTALADAGHHFRAARRRLRHPLVSPLRVVPVVGRHIRAGDRLVATAGGATDLARGAVADLRELAGRDLRAGPDRLAVVEDLADVAAAASHDLAALDPGSSDSLVAPVADAVEQLRGERDDASAGLDRAARAADALAGVLAGPEPYLLLGANNAEMRAGSGMFLSAAEIRPHQGGLELGDVRPTQTLVLPAGMVPVDGDLADNWPWLDPGRDLRNMGLTVDFPQSAALVAANWERVAGGGPVSGVIVVDVDALRSLLEVVGPVEVDGVTYSAETVRNELLRAQYHRDEGRDVRRDRVGEVAWEVFQRIESGDWELAPMVEALVDSAQRRHLLVWSSDPAQQEAWTTAGVDGSLRSDSVAVAMLNRGANKVDTFVATEASMELVPPAGGEVDEGGRATIELGYRITNSAPTTGPRYQVGPNVDGLEAGDHRAIVAVNLPAGSTDVEVDGFELLMTGTDGPAAVVAGEVEVPAGSSATLRVTARLPAGLDRVVLEPSARVPRTAWTVAGRRYEIDRRRTVPVPR